MKTQLTFQFDTPEEAIAFMAKTFMPEEKKSPAETVSAKKSPAAAASVAVPGTPKRGPGRPPKKAGDVAGNVPAALGDGRATAGAAGQVTKPDGTTVRIEPSTTTPTTAAPSRPAPQPAAPVKNPPTEEVSSVVQTPDAAAPASGQAVPDAAAIVSALQRVLTAKGMPAAQAIFQRHGVKRGAEVKPEDRVAFIAYCDKVAKGEIDPAKAEA